MDMRDSKFYFLWFSLIAILLFIIQVTVSGFTGLFMLTESALVRPWQFLTAVFLHGSISHLVYNLFALIIFGFILEQLIGSKRFLILFITTGIIANLISFPWSPNALGASGAIMAVIGTLAVLRPMMSVWSFGMILPMFIVAILWVTGSVIGIFGFGNQGVGHLAHLSGIVFGLAYGTYLRVKTTRKRGHTFFESKLKIPEESMQLWEDRYMGK